MAEQAEAPGAGITHEVSSRNLLIAIIVISVLLRVAVALYLGDTTPPAKDETSYATLAARLASGHGYSFPVAWYPFAPADAPTSHWSFLYTGFVAALYAVFGPHPLAARLAGALLSGILMPWLTFRLARRMMVRPSDAEHSHTIPLLAATLVAVYPYFVLYGAMVQTEALFICAVLWSLERGLALQTVLAEPHAGRHTLKIGLTLGLSLGIATLLRQSILPWVAVMFLYLLLWGLKTADWRRLKTWQRLLTPLMLAGVVIIACVLPFTLRNYRVYNAFLLLNSNAGYAMYSAQHPDHGTSFREYWAAPLPADLLAQGLNEAQWDKALTQRGLGFVLADPGRYLLLSLSRVPDYFEFWPTADSSTLFNAGRVLSIGILFPFMLGGIVFALTAAGRRIFKLHATAFLIVFMAFYSVLHILTWAMSRYRLPVDAVALPFAALALSQLARWLAFKRRRIASTPA